MSRRKLNAGLLCMLALVSNTIVLYSPLARSGDAIPTHCKQDEFAFLNAKMRLSEKNQVDKNIPKREIEKILSLCADKGAEPLTRMFYRFGVAEKIEIEVAAFIKNKAGLSTQFDRDAHAGLISIEFAKGRYTYEVSEGMGMTSGVHLNVYKSRKNILAIQSEAFESEMSQLNLNKVSSPIFKLVKPIVPW